MRYHGRGQTMGTLAMLAMVVGLMAGPRSGLAQPSPVASSMLTDAQLNDVFFIDPDRGWAVGDRGAIWHTEDGGRNWRLQDAPVACGLSSVWFIDDRRGWIVGGWTHPYTHRTTGVVLRTEDGGRRWELVPRLSLPTLRRVKFFDLRHGWAVGDASALYPVGVFRTEDGGLSWSSVPAAGGGTWIEGDFVDAQSGVIVGRNVPVAQVHQRGVADAQAPPTGPRTARCVRLPGRSTQAADVVPAGWLVGDGGLVLRTSDSGRHWTPPPTRLPGGVADYFDFRGVSVVGSRVWIVGSPGTRVLHSSDAGTTWHLFETGQSLPLRAVHFLDAHRGWAVGAMGTILATRDGGHRWTIQRQGGARAAWLALISRPNHLPLEWIVNVAGNEGYLGAAYVLHAPAASAASALQAHLEDRLCEAVTTLGGCSAELSWQFPLPVAGDHQPLSEIVAQWERLHGSAEQDRLQEYLVRKIRQWRPEVIITEPTRPRSDDQLAQWINQAVLSAIEAAADPLAETDQALVTGLGPWETKKVFGFEGPDQTGSVNLTTAQLAARLGTSLADHAALGRQLLESQHRWPAQTLGFRLLQSRIPGELSRQDFFSGIPMQPGSATRRPLHSHPPQDLRTVSRLIQQRRNIEQLLRYASSSSQHQATWFSQVENLIRDLDASSGAQVLFELAHSLRNSGELERAADVYDYLLQRFPDDPLCESAAIWLIQYSSSGEAQWAFRSAKLPTESIQSLASPAVVLPSGVVPAEHLAEIMPTPAVDWQQTVQESSSTVAKQGAQRTRQPSDYAHWIRERYPSLLLDPLVRFPLLAARRASTSASENEGYLNSLAASRLSEAWSACARSELWIASPTRVAPKPLAVCVVADQPPLLDGRLDDPTWQNSEPLQLVSDQGDDAHWPAAVLLAHDDQYLYIAANCRKVPGVAYPSSSEKRTRDPDLSRRDRIEILLDIDRDYATYYRLVIDHRGWVRDECLGSPAWQPRWYVAAAEDDVSWTVECAIPWSELVQHPPASHQYWAIGVQRIAPGGGFQSWNQPASPDIRPEGFGLLKFP